MPVAWSAVAFISAPVLGGFFSGFQTRKEVKGWYQTLKKPSWTPPNWLFGPMWTSLYAGMGYASYLVWRDGGGFDGARLPLALYASKLVLNFAWTPIFFIKHNVSLAFYEILALYANTVACGIAFYHVNQTAGFIFVPYVGWLTLASALSYSIYRKNPSIEDAKKD